MPPTNGSDRQETPKSPNFPRFSLLFILIIISLLVAPFFLTDNIFNICVFFATFTALTFALTDLIIYLSKEPPRPTIIHINSIENENKKTNKNSLSIVVKKVVHYAQQYRVAVSRFMHSIFRTKWLIKIFTIALSFPISLTLTEHWKEIVGKVTAVLEFFIVDNKPLGISILITTLFILIIFFKNVVSIFQKIMASLTSKYFVFTLASLAIIGALSALLIPSYTGWFREPGYTSAQQDSAKETPEKAQETPNSTASPTGNKAAEVEQKSTSDLRLHLLYITGGIIAILGLIETNRKNSQDHIRQVHATRRDRYIEAVDKLSSEQAPVRLGGVYALVGLVDEWLDDESINQETRFKEGQVIINNLCAYIRSPFSPAARVEEHQAYRYYENLKREPDKDPITQDPYRFAFIFSRFFLNNYQEPDTLAADTDAFHEEQDVRRTIFTEMSKRSSTLKIGKNIDDVTIIPGAWSDFDFNFSRAPIFYSLDNLTIEKPYFPHARFYGDASFNTTNFTKNADFSHSFYIGKAEFTFARFFQPADFTLAHFFEDVDFMFTRFSQGATFNYARFSETANFIKAIFGEGAYFNEVTFNKEAQIGGVTFSQKAEFIKTFFFQEADFVNTTFTQKVDFGNTTFKKYEPIFVSENSTARFSVSMAQEDYNFSLRSDSRSIQLGKAELDGIIRWIPVGAVLFDPDSWDEEKWKYTRKSKPAKPLKNSDEEKEKPAE